MKKFEDVDIGIGMGNNMMGVGGRRHGFQILKERAGNYRVYVYHTCFFSQRHIQKK